MLTYKYIENFYIENENDEIFCKENNIVYFRPSINLKLWLENWLKVTTPPIIDCVPDVTCYWRYFGSWGMYHPEDNSISICPYQIQKAPGGLVGVIRHELTHLQHPEANNMSFEDKERYIETKSV
jgi:hypothetical protein